MNAIDKEKKVFVVNYDIECPCYTKERMRKEICSVEHDYLIKKQREEEIKRGEII